LPHPEIKLGKLTPIYTFESTDLAERFAGHEDFWSTQFLNVRPKDHKNYSPQNMNIAHDFDLVASMLEPERELLDKKAVCWISRKLDEQCRPVGYVENMDATDAYDKSLGFCYRNKIDLKRLRFEGFVDSLTPKILDWNLEKLLNGKVLLRDHPYLSNE
jgi:hypothetical protein